MSVVPEYLKEQNLAVSLPKRERNHMVLFKNVKLELLQDRLFEKHCCQLLLDGVLSPSDKNLRAYVICPISNPVSLLMFNFLAVIFQLINDWSIRDSAHLTLQDPQPVVHTHSVLELAEVSDHECVSVEAQSAVLPL